MVKMISMQELETLLSDGFRFTLLDVRDADEFFQGHLSGAINIPLEELGSRTRDLRRNSLIIVYCTHGSRSLMAARMLSNLGFEAMAAAGGLSSYRGRFYVDRHL